MHDTVRAIIFARDNNFLPELHAPILVIGDNEAGLATILPQADYITDYAGSDKLWRGHQTANQTYQTVILLTPQQKNAALYQIATALNYLEPGGLLVTAAANDAGGKTLPAMLTPFGRVTDTAKHKCRVAWVTRTPDLKVDNIITANGPQLRTDGLWTQPGVFSWDHSDIGTLLLKKFIPQDIKGNAADFGCGIGELGLALFGANPDLKNLVSIDHDKRAVDCCARNLGPYASRHQAVWQDIPSLATKPSYDFIIMNPPFHTGKDMSQNLGRSFIIKAAQSLKPGGQLRLVANNHLAYEELIKENFSHVTELTREQGFKIIEAVK